MIFAQADFFLVPLLDGRHGVGQVFASADCPPGAAHCGLTLHTAAPGDTIAPFAASDIIAAVFVGTESLEDGTWPLAGFDQIPAAFPDVNLVALKSLGFADTPVHEPAVIEAFLSAAHGLYDWTAFGPLFDTMRHPAWAGPAV